MITRHLRLCEHESRHVDWDHATREAVAQAAEHWRLQHGLAQPPLAFEGADGRLLCAQQHVGVVEAGGVCVEIYPKLDSALVDDPGLIEERAGTVMANLHWLLAESGYGNLVDAGEASVDDSPEGMADLLAWLFALRMRQQLGLGMPQEYVGRREDLRLVRGRIEFSRQATVHFGRPDVIACAWDDFTPDTPLARLLKCAAELLLARVRLASAASALRDALAMLEDVASVHPLEAMSQAAGIRWSRLNARWRSCHDLALAALRGLGREMHSGGTESFVFLLDMNALFECHCARWLERRWRVPVQEQVRLGTLLVSPNRRLGQDADFLWLDDDVVWVGDAKYKRPNAGEWPKIDDVRQIICYGQMVLRLHPGKCSRLMLLFPTTGHETASEHEAFDGQALHLQGVSIVRPRP
ncbi:MAG: McrC family protein [Prosthecobacter sp.]